MKQRDPLNDLILPLLGAALLGFLLLKGWIPFSVIKAILTEGL